MASTFELLESELKVLVETGDNLEWSMRLDCYPDSMRENFKNAMGDKTEQFIKALPNFKSEYQTWYSEAQAVVRQILPDRLGDFVGHYEPSKTRKELTNATYVISDYLQGYSMSNWEGETTVGPNAALGEFSQQLSILKSAQKRFESSLFDIKQFVQADLIDTEIEASRYLAKNKFLRAAGAVAGVVLEKHLHDVSSNHSLKTRKKRPTISDLNDMLKDGDVIDTVQWRFNQHLGDIRNLCDHKRDKEPTLDQVNDLIDGVAKITKTIF